MDVDSQPTMEETVLVGDDLMLGPPSPIIPPEIASHVLEGVNLCDGILRTLFLCLQVNDIEPFCQEELVLYRDCAAKRDKEIRQRLEDSERKLGLSMPLDEAKARASQLESEVTTLERSVTRLGRFISLWKLLIAWPLIMRTTFCMGVDRTKIPPQPMHYGQYSQYLCFWLIHACLHLYVQVQAHYVRLILASGIEGIEGFRQRWSLHGRLSDARKRLESLTQGIENRKKDVQKDELAQSSTTKRWFFW